MRTASVIVPALLLLQPSVHIKEEHAEQWTAEDPATNGCIVIVENDPEPGAASGRFSFNGANEQVEEQKASFRTSDLKAAACPCQHLIICCCAACLQASSSCRISHLKQI